MDKEAHYRNPPPSHRGLNLHITPPRREKIKRLSTSFLILSSLIGCQPKKPLAVLPSEAEVRILELETENGKLRSELDSLTGKCSKVLELYKRGRAYSNSSEAKQK